MALLGSVVHDRSASVRAEATRMFLEIAAAHGICPKVDYPVPEFATLAEGGWVHRVARALAVLGVGLYNCIACPRAAQVQLQSAPGNVITLRTAKLQDGDTCCLTVPHTTPWHGHHAPHHRFHDNDDPWPAAVRECLNRCAGEHLHYRCCEQGPTDHPGWRDALVHLFHTTSTQDPRLRLFHPTRAKQDGGTVPQVTLDGLHLGVVGYHCQGSLPPPTHGPSYHPQAAVLYILRDVLGDGEHQAPNADVAWPRLYTHGPTRRRRCGCRPRTTNAPGQQSKRSSGPSG